MSVKIPTEQLPEVVADYGPTAYVVTGDGSGAPRITHVSPVFIAGGAIEVVLGGAASRAAEANPTVSILWPASSDQSMSLIVDGEAEVRSVPGPDTTVTITPTTAVRHRPAPPG